MWIVNLFDSLFFPPSLSISALSWSQHTGQLFCTIISQFPVWENSPFVCVCVQLRDSIHTKTRWAYFCCYSSVEYWTHQIPSAHFNDLLFFSASFFLYHSSFIWNEPVGFIAKIFYCFCGLLFSVESLLLSLSFGAAIILQVL